MVPHESGSDRLVHHSIVFKHLSIKCESCHYPLRLPDSDDAKIEKNLQPLGIGL